MKKKRRIVLCSIMTLVMALVMAMPISASADVGESDVARIGDTGYTTVNAAIADAGEGDEIVLLKTVSEVLHFNKSCDIILNLNNFTVDTTSVDSYDVVRVEAADVTLEIKNGTLKNTVGTAYGIYAFQNASNLNLTLDNVTVETGDTSLGVQGLTSNSNVIVMNSRLTSETTAIYYPPKSGTMEIINSVVTGVDNGIVHKGGNLKIKGDATVITATGSAGEAEAPYGGDPNNPASFPKTGNAVYLEGGYTDREMFLTIEGGTFISENNQAVYQKSFGQPEDTIDTMISAGNFSSDVTQYVENDRISIKYTDNSGSTYYVGTQAQINEIVKAAGAGDKIDVLQGDIALDIPTADVQITNSGTGEISVNGETVIAGETIMTKGQASTQLSTTTPADETTTASNDKAVATGDDFNMTALLAIMGIAAAAAAGTVVYVRRKRSN